ncbi:efflux RND transporter permease subunit, partial [Pseudomonas syringae pv. tagetis]|uniref:efflux RND transporter permease subunit n=1 Tax=Pseudomonas syringae group genomosp. 7 TaxID=251699 RepID=UPI00376F733E
KIFVRCGMEAVILSMFEAQILVVLVLIMFLQTWRASINPLVAVPVSMIGTFPVMHIFAYSQNAHTLIRLELANAIQL